MIENNERDLHASIHKKQKHIVFVLKVKIGLNFILNKNNRKKMVVQISEQNSIENFCLGKHI